MISLWAVSENVYFTEVLLKEESELNKRSYVEKIILSAVFLFSQLLVQLTTFQSETFTEQNFFLKYASLKWKWAVKEERSEVYWKDNYNHFTDESN